jgi:hypothetical protein
MSVSQIMTWGHCSGPNGLSDELVLDDVILNEVQVPEPSVFGLLGLFGPMFWWQHRARKTSSAA